MTAVERLNEIEARAEFFRVMDEGPSVPTEVWGVTSSGSARDVPALVAALRAVLVVASERRVRDLWVNPEDILDAITAALDVTP